MQVTPRHGHARHAWSSVTVSHRLELRQVTHPLEWRIPSFACVLERREKRLRKVWPVPAYPLPPARGKLSLLGTADVHDAASGRTTAFATSRAKK